MSLNDVIKVSLSLTKSENCDIKLLCKGGDYVKKDQKIAVVTEKKEGVLTEKSSGSEVKVKAKQNFIKSPVYGKLIDYSKEDHCFFISPCKHEKLFGKMCITCGFVTSETSNNSIYNSLSNEISFSENLANKYVKSMVNKYLKERKLILLLDLDNTILHTSPLNLSEKEYKNLKEKHKESLGLIAVRQPNVNRFDQLVVKFRKHLKEFLNVAKEKYEIYIYTHGTKEYAVGIIEYINNNFSDKALSTKRMLSRESDENGMLKIKSIKNFFPTNVNMIVVIDDRKDVWMEKEENLLMISPYLFFYDKKYIKTDKNNKQIVEYCVEFDYDNVLYVFKQMLSFINKAFYEIYEKFKIKKSVEIIISEKLSSIYNGIKFYYHEPIQNKSSKMNKNEGGYIKESLRFKIEKFGGEFLSEDKERFKADFILMRSYDKEDKLTKEIDEHNKTSETKITLLSYSYIEICFIFYYQISYDPFILSEQRKQIQNLNLDEIFNLNKSGIDEFYGCENVGEDGKDGEKEREERELSGDKGNEGDEGNI